MKIFAIVVIAVVLYFAIFNQNSFKKEFDFGGDRYAFNRSQGGGDFENFFYTVGGEDVPGYRQVVQIVKIPKEVVAEQYEYYMQPLFTRYKLKEYDGETLTRAGNFEQAGLKFKSFSAPVSVDDKIHMAFYLTSVKEKRGRHQILTDLRNIKFE